MKDRFLCCTSS